MNIPTDHELLIWAARLTLLIALIGMYKQSQIMYAILKEVKIDPTLSRDDIARLHLRLSAAGFRLLVAVMIITATWFIFLI